MPNEALLTTAEVADAFRVSVKTVGRWARTGAVPSVKVGGTRRFHRSDVEALLTPRDAEAEAS